MRVRKVELEKIDMLENPLIHRHNLLLETLN